MCFGGYTKRTCTRPEKPLEVYVRADCFEVLVTDPRPTDIFSQSLTFDVDQHTHMQADRGRCTAFASALVEHAVGKVVLEIGTGPSALLAVIAARAGATRVYALEGDKAAATAAQRHVDQLVCDGSLSAGCIVILPKFSTELTAADCPEPVQLVVHELLGTFASSEGVRHFFDDARHRAQCYTDTCLSVPHRAQSMLAPGVAPSLALLHRVPSRHTAIGPSQKYLLVGRAGALPPSLLAAAALPFEDLRFNGWDAEGIGAGTVGREGDEGSMGGVTNRAFAGEGCRRLAGRDGGGKGGGGGGRGREEQNLSFTATRDATVDGFYAWMRFQASEGHEWVDSYTGSSDGQSTSWAVLFLPLGAPMIVRAGEVLHVSCTVIGGDTCSPAYAFRFGGADPLAAPRHAVSLSLAELYPLSGGEWCRACAGTTASVADEQRLWRHCKSCGAAYHRICVGGDTLAAPAGDHANAPWRCAACVRTESFEHRLESDQ